MTLRDILRSDDGFSLIELTAASVVGLLVLGAVYLLFTTGMTSFKGVENNTIAARSAAEVLQRMARPIREAEQVSVARDYEIEVLADPDDDGNSQFVRFYIPAGTHTLKMDRTPGPSHSGTMTPVVISDNVQNLLQGSPLVSYYTTAGASPGASEASRTAGSRMVRLLVLTRANVTPVPPTYRAQTDVFMRNRAQQ